jgi:hypothetical protein
VDLLERGALQIPIPPDVPSADATPYRRLMTQLECESQEIVWVHIVAKEELQMPRSTTMLGAYLAVYEADSWSSTIVDQAKLEQMSRPSLLGPELIAESSKLVVGHPNP